MCYAGAYAPMIMAEEDDVAFTHFDCLGELDGV